MIFFQMTLMVLVIVMLPTCYWWGASRKFKHSDRMIVDLEAQNAFLKKRLALCVEDAERLNFIAAHSSQLTVFKDGDVLYQVDGYQGCHLGSDIRESIDFAIRGAVKVGVLPALVKPKTATDWQDYDKHLEPFDEVATARKALEEK